MVLNDLDILARDPNQSDLYNLFTKTYVDFPRVNAKEYIVDQDEEMRMDLISYRIYNDVKYVDFLCNFNQIDNPLNVMPGDVIRYVTPEEVTLFKNEEAQVEDVQRKLLNANKSTRKDPSRKTFVEEGFSLPPNFLPEPKKPINFEGNIMVIG
jgi:hypothetical protein